MKILVCVSKTPETTARIAFTNGNTEFDSSGVQFIMNPYDEWYALVRAIELQEAHGGTVTIINVGPAENDTVIRKGLAIGADEAVRVDVSPRSALYVAKQIAEYAREQQFDIIFAGKETIDHNGSEVGAMVAEYLDMPFISFATTLSLEGERATISREIEGGEEVQEVNLPFVVSAAKGMAEQRIPNMRGIMMAKKKPLNVIPPVPFEDLAVATSYTLPPAKTAVKLVSPDNMDELVRLLHEEAKVI
ncbi:MAG: electron transfer flavoprotein subunit beta/FixA family protein [Phaeodactylibacter sp.]|nr:electron transfer flavoprotein subunit beta/FixA family protein [Phaeodactylibacter sp.]MCB9274254.1 electron transfer flavoprotein subunit beta/FixA family protein [Lewinellaceae bacterium]